MQIPHIKFGRTAACILVVAVFFSIFEFQLFNWQVINGDKFEQEALSHRTDAVEIQAARGEILDRNGNVLAGNHIVYQVIYNALYMDDSQRNATILEVIDLLEELEEPWRDILPIQLDAEGNFQFKEGEEDEIETLKSRDYLNLADYATADDCIRELAKRYRYQGFSKEDTRTVVAVRYCMTRDGFSINEPYVFATGVSSETVGVFRESANRWPGVETRVNVSRYYDEDGFLAPHLIGSTGEISEAGLEKAEENGTLYDSETNIAGYRTKDIVGIDGAEGAFEEYLRGKRGQEAVYTDENGNVTTTALRIQPEQGHTVQLTLDSYLQTVANRSLEKNIQASFAASTYKDPKKDCISGAAVAIDISDFGVLACSSYPSYDLNKITRGSESYDGEYHQSLLDDLVYQPLNNRALTGRYVPGSVFKPLVAIAGLQEGIVGAGESIYDCNMHFVYEDLDLACTDMHGNANMYTAIAESCNAYFCQLGLDLKIRRLDAYAQCFGLGEYTGVELYEEKGNMTSPQTYRNLHADTGAQWTDGNTAQAAIGQADDLFTPIQLATYAATIATGGRRYRTHFLQNVLDYSGQELIERYQPELLYDAEISPDVTAVVTQAMCQTATSGTARGVFSNYPVSVACKTGTAETSGIPYKEGGTGENISFICFAPAEDPKIAVAVMLQHGHQGPHAQNVAKDILDAYFEFYTWDEEGHKFDQDGNMVDDDGKVLKTKEELDEEAARREQAAQSPSGSPRPSPSGDQPSGNDAPSATPDPTPTPTPQPSRGSDIPDTIFTGGAPAPSPDPSQPEAADPTPIPSNDTPFYRGSGQTPEPGDQPEEDEEGEEYSGEEGPEDDSWEGSG